MNFALWDGRFSPDGVVLHFPFLHCVLLLLVSRQPQAVLSFQSYRVAHLVCLMGHSA
jgi:hypothetical protein